MKAEPLPAHAIALRLLRLDAPASNCGMPQDWVRGQPAAFLGAYEQKDQQGISTSGGASGTVHALMAHAGQAPAVGLLVMTAYYGRYGDSQDRSRSRSRSRSQQVPADGGSEGEQEAAEGKLNLKKCALVLSSNVRWSEDGSLPAAPSKVLEWIRQQGLEAAWQKEAGEEQKHFATHPAWRHLWPTLSPSSVQLSDSSSRCVSTGGGGSAVQHQGLPAAATAAGTASERPRKRARDAATTASMWGLFKARSQKDQAFRWLYQGGAYYVLPDTSAPAAATTTATTAAAASAPVPRASRRVAAAQAAAAAVAAPTTALQQPTVLCRHHGSAGGPSSAEPSPTVAHGSGVLQSASSMPSSSLTSCGVESLLDGLGQLGAAAYPSSLLALPDPQLPLAPLSCPGSADSSGHAVYRGDPFDDPFIDGNLPLLESQGPPAGLLPASAAGLPAPTSHAAAPAPHAGPLGPWGSAGEPVAPAGSGVLAAGRMATCALHTPGMLGAAPSPSNILLNPDFVPMFEPSTQQPSMQCQAAAQHAHGPVPTPTSAAATAAAGASSSAAQPLQQPAPGSVPAAEEGLAAAILRMSLQAPAERHQQLWDHHLHHIFWDLLRGQLGIGPAGVQALMERCQAVGLVPGGATQLWADECHEPNSKSDSFSGRTLLELICDNYTPDTKWRAPGAGTAEPVFPKRTTPVSPEDRAAQVRSLMEVAQRQGATPQQLCDWVAGSPKALRTAASCYWVPVVKELLRHMQRLTPVQALCFESGPKGKWCVLHAVCRPIRPKPDRPEFYRKLQEDQRQVVRVLLTFLLHLRPEHSRGALGHLIHEMLVHPPGGKRREFEPAVLQEACQEMGISVAPAPAAAAAAAAGPQVAGAACAGSGMEVSAAMQPCPDDLGSLLAEDDMDMEEDDWQVDLMGAVPDAPERQHITR